jgi:hypothetical protein
VTFKTEEKVSGVREKEKKKKEKERRCQLRRERLT